MVAEFWSMWNVQEQSKDGYHVDLAVVWVVPEEVDLMSISSTPVGKIMNENVKDIDWSVSARPRDVDLIVIGMLIIIIKCLLMTC